jgi:glycosyltransferase involved in cell wall biosynthesis
MVTGEYPPDVGGVADYTALLARHLSALGVEPRIVTGLGWDLSCLSRIAALAAGCDVVHLQYQPAAYGLRGAITLLPVWLRLTRPGMPVVTTFHDLRAPYLFPKAGPLRRLVVHLLLRSSHAAIFSAAEDLDASGPGPYRRCIPIGSNVSLHPLPAGGRAALRARVGVERDESLVGFFGLLNASKGLETLLDALVLARQHGTAARLLLIGEPLGHSDPRNRATSADLQRHIARLGLTDRVHTTGWLAADEVSAYLQACDLVALPYRDGASARRGSLLAALAHGLPIVTTAAPGRRPFLEHDGQALLVPPDEPSALAAALERLAADAALRARLSRGAAQAAERFDWQTIASATLQLYQEVVQRSPARA